MRGYRTIGDGFDDEGVEVVEGGQECRTGQLLLSACEAAWVACYVVDEGFGLVGWEVVLADVGDALDYVVEGVVVAFVVGEDELESMGGAG